MRDFLRFRDFVGALTGRLRPANDGLRLRSTIVLEIRDRDGRLKHRSEQHNLKTNAGNDLLNTNLFSTGATVAQANFIALTTDAAAPAAGDTTLASEETTNGLARAQASVSHSAGVGSTQLTKTFTYTGAVSKVIAKVGLFNAALNGTMFLETLLSTTGTVNTNGDTITITWTVTY